MRIYTRAYWGLAAVVDTLDFERNGRRVPFGWKAMHVPGRDAHYLMPLWVYWPCDIRWRVTRTLVRLGFLQGAEGGDFGQMRWSLRVWKNEPYLNVASRPPMQEREWRMYRQWYRFWLWLAADWKERMPTTYTACDEAREAEPAAFRDAVAFLSDLMRTKADDLSAMVNDALLYGRTLVYWERGKPVARSLTADMLIDAARTLQS